MWGFYLGKKSYGTSSLTRTTSSTTGFELSHAGAQLNSVVQVFQGVDQGSPSLGVGLSRQKNNMRVGLNFVRHPANHIFGAEFELVPLEGINLAMEVARGSEADGISGAALTTKVEGNALGASYALSLTYGQEGFPGLDGNTLRRSASLRLPLPSNVTIGGFYNDQLVDARLKRTYGAHLTAPLNKRGTATLSWRNYLEDGLNETKVTLSAVQRFSRVYLNGWYQWRTKSGDALRVAASFYPKVGLGGSVYYAQGGLTRGNRSHTIGASTSLSLAESTRLKLNLQYEMGQRNKTTLEANLVHPLRDNFDLKAQLKTSYSEGKWDTTGMIAGTIYFGIPGAKRHGLGTITGLVYDGQGEGQFGLAGAIVRVGNHAAVTARDGSFEFAGLQPGEYYVQVESPPLADELLPAIFLGNSIILEEDQVVTFDVPMVPKTSITGQIASEGFPRFEGSLAGIVMYARQGDDVVTTVTDTHGAFAFTELYPGMWEIIVNAGGRLGTMHVVEMPASLVDLTPGVSENLDIRIVPKNNGTPKIIGGGTLTTK